MRLSDMPVDKARECMKKTVGVIGRIRQDAEIKELESYKNSPDAHMNDFIMQSVDKVTGCTYQDEILCAMTDRSMDEVKAMTMSEYMEALKEVDFKVLRDFFIWWAAMVYAM